MTAPTRALPAVASALLLAAALPAFGTSVSATPTPPPAAAQVRSAKVRHVSRTVVIDVKSIGTSKTVRIRLSPRIVVSDTRGGTGTWTATATMTAVKHGSARSWVFGTFSPSCRVITPGSAPGIKAGPAKQPTTRRMTICTKNRRVGAGHSTSGRYALGGHFTFRIPPHSPTGTYKATFHATITFHA